MYHRTLNSAIGRADEFQSNETLQMRVSAFKFLTPFLIYITLTSAFASKMAMQGFLPQFLSFTSPLTSQLFLGLLQAIGSERVHSAGVAERIGALIVFSELKKSLVVSGFEPRPLSIALFPQA